MQISTDFFQTLNAAGIDLSSAFAWFDADAYDPSYRQVLVNPIGLETLQMEYLHFKVTYVNAIIRSNANADSLVIWAGEIRLIDDYPAGASGNYQPLNSTLSALSVLSNSLGWLRNDSLGGLSWNQYPLNLTVGVNADSLPAITDNGSGSITVASTTANLKASTTGIQEIITYSIASATLTVSANATYYLCIDYNSGSPIYYIEGNKYNINDSTICAVYALWYVAGKIYYQPFGNNGKALSNKINYSIANTQPYKLSIAGGLLISESSLAIAATGAVVYAGTTPISLSAFDSTAIYNYLYPVYHVAGVWTYGSAVTTYDASYYDDGTNWVQIPNSKYSVRWYYRAVDANNTSIYYVYGSNYYNTIDNANAETPRTDLPQFISEYCILIGKSIVQYGATSGLTYSIFNTQYSASLSGSYLPLSGGTLTGDLTTANILPSANQAYNLGSLTNEFNNIYTLKVLPQGVTSNHSLGSSSNYWWNIYSYNMHVRNDTTGGGITWDNAVLRTTAIANTLESDGSYLYFTNSSGTRYSLTTSASLSGYLPLTAGSSYPLTGTVYSQSIIPTSSGSYDLGSGSVYFNNAYIALLHGVSAILLGALTCGNANTYNIVPNTTSTYNLGSTSLYWNNIYTNAVNIAGAGIWRTYTGDSTYCFAYGAGVTPAATNYSMGFDAAATMTWLNASSAVYINISSSTVMSFASGAMTAYGNIAPSTNNTYNLGSSSYEWNNIYANYATIGNTGIGYWNYSTSQFWVGHKGLNSASVAYGLNGNANGSIGLYAIDGYGVNIGTSNTYNTLVVKTGVVTSQANILPYSNSVYYLGDSSHYWQTTFSNYIYAKYSGIDVGYFSQNGSYAQFGHNSCMSNTNYCLLHSVNGDSYLNGYSNISFQIANTPIANITSSAFIPNSTSTYNLGSTSLYWNTLYCNTINCNVINSSSAITVTGGIISYTYDETGAFSPTDATGNIVRVAYAGLTTITLSSANLSSGKVIEIHLGTTSTARIACDGIPAYIHYSTANIVTVNAGATSSTIAAKLILRIVRVGSQFDITVS